jgi:hypothetical protein
MKRPDFGDVLKNRQFSFSGVKSPLLTTLIQIHTKILGYLTGHRLGSTIFAHVEVY